MLRKVVIAWSKSDAKREKMFNEGCWYLFADAARDWARSIVNHKANKDRGTPKAEVTRKYYGEDEFSSCDDEMVFEEKDGKFAVHVVEATGRTAL